MLLRELLEEIDFYEEDRTVQVEVNGVVHDIHYVNDDSQAIYLVVDGYEEERELR